MSIIIKYLTLFSILTSVLYSDISSNLTLKYAFENDINDSSGNGYNLVLGDVGSEVFVPGRFGSAYSFLGTDNWLEDNGSWGLSTSSVGTFAFWIKANLQTNLGAIIASYDGVNKAILYGENGTNNLLLSDDTTGDTLNPANVWDNQWHHVTITFNGSSTNFYVDGNLALTGSSGTPAIGTGFNLGEYNNFSGRQFTGLLDEVHIYSRELNATDVTELYTSQPGKLYSYVTDNLAGTVDVVDVITQSIIKTIPVGTNPNFVSTSNDDKFVYVSNNSANSVSVIDTLSNTVVQTIAGITGPGWSVPSHNGDYLYVQSSNNEVFKVELNTSTPTSLSAAICTGYQIRSLDLSFDDAKLYASCFADNGTNSPVAVINTANGGLMTNIVTGNTLTEAQVTSDGAFLYSMETKDNNADGFVSLYKIDTATDNIVDEINITNDTTYSHWQIELNSNATKAYIVHATQQQLLTVDLLTKTVTTDTYPDANQSHTLQLSPDGKKVYSGIYSKPDIYAYDVFSQTFTTINTGSSTSATYDTNIAFAYSGGTFPPPTPPVELSLKAHGGVIQFDGVTTSKATASYTGTITSHTVEAWINTKDTTDFAAIFNLGEDGLVYSTLSLSNSGFLNSNISDFGSDSLTSTSIINDGIWHHVAMSYDATGGNYAIYVDGIKESNVTFSGIFNALNPNMDIGIGSDFSPIPWKGEIDELRVWDIAKTESELFGSMHRQLEGNETNLVSYYNFDERLGYTFVDIAGGDNNATSKGDVTRLNFLGNSLSTTNIDFGVHPEHNLVGNMSFSGWIKTVAGALPIIAKYAGGDTDDDYNVNYNFMVASDGSLSYDHEYTGGFNEGLTTGPGVVVMNEWQHISVTRDTTLKEYKMYVNGKLVSTSTYVNNPVGGSLGPLFTSGSTQDEYSEFSLWDKVLTPQEIQHVMHSHLLGNEAGLVGYWPFNEGIGNSATDHSSNSKNGTITDTVWNNNAPIIYGTNIYTTDTISSSEQLVLEHTITAPTYSYNGTVPATISDFNSATGEFIYTASGTAGETLDFNASDDIISNTLFNVTSYVAPVLMLDVNVTLSNVNLLEHNITSIQIFGVDGNSEVITITDANTLLSGENNLSTIIMNPDQNYSIKFDVDHSGISRSYYYNFTTQTLDSIELYDMVLADYKTEINIANTSFTIDTSSANFYSALKANFMFSGLSDFWFSGDLVTYIDGVVVANSTLGISVNNPVDYNISIPHIRDNQNVAVQLNSYNGDGIIDRNITIFEQNNLNFDDILVIPSVTLATLTLNLEALNSVQFISLYDTNNKLIMSSEIQNLPDNFFKLPVLDYLSYGTLELTYFDGNSAKYDSLNNIWVDSSINTDPFGAIATDLNLTTVIPTVAPTVPTLIFPTSPLSTYALTDNTLHVTLSSDETKAFVANGANGLVVLDISDENNITLLGDYNSSGYVNKVLLSSDETRAYLSDNSNGFFILNITDLANITLVDSIPTFNSLDIVLSNDGNTSYVADNSSGLLILDISDDTNITQIGQYDTLGLSQAIALSVDGTKAYIADEANGVVVLDISDPMNIIKLGEYKTQGPAYDVALAPDQTTLYIADETHGLIVLDVTTPSNITQMATYNPKSPIYTVTLSNDGSKAYIISDDHGMLVLDVTIASDIRIISSYKTSGYTYNSTLSSTETKAFISDQTNGIAIFDISNKIVLSQQFTTHDVSMSVADLDEDNLTITLNNSNAFVTVTPNWINDVNSSVYNASDLNFTIDNTSFTTGTSQIDIIVSDGVHPDIFRSLTLEVFADDTNTSFAINNVNLADVNITDIIISGVDGNFETYNLPDVVDGNNSFTAITTAVNQNFEFAVNVDYNGNLQNFYYNFTQDRLDSVNLFDPSSNDYKTIINDTLADFTVNVQRDQFHYKADATFNFTGNPSLLDSAEIRATIIAPTSSLLLTEYNLTDSGTSSYTLSNFYANVEDNQNLEYSLYKNTGMAETSLVFAKETNANNDLIAGFYTIELSELTLNFDDINVISSISVISTDGMVSTLWTPVSTLWTPVSTPTSVQTIALVNNKDYLIKAVFTDNSIAKYNLDNNSWVDSTSIVTPLYLTSDTNVTTSIPATSPNRPTLSIVAPQLLFNEANTTLPLLDEYNTTGNVYGVTLSLDGMTVYVADNANGISLFDITGAPFELGNFNISGSAYHIVPSKDGSKAYIAYGVNGLVVVDITDPFSITEIGRYDTLGNAVSVVLSDDETKAYISDSTNGLVVVDITTPTPQLINTVSTTGNTQEAVLSDDGLLAYIADFSNTLTVIDISSNSPLLIGEVNATVSGQAYSIKLSSDGSKVYIADAVNGLVAIDVTTPSVPVVLSEFTDVSTIYGVTLSKDNTKAYLTGDSTALSIVDLTTNTLLGSYSDTSSGSYVTALSADESMAYIANSENGLTLLDVILTHSQPHHFTTTDINISVGDLDLNDLNITVNSNNPGLIFVTPQWSNAVASATYNTNDLIFTVTNTGGGSTGLAIVDINLEDGIHNPVIRRLHIDVYSDPVNTTFNLSNVNLSEHNITNIQVMGVDGNMEDFPMAGSQSLVDGDNNITVPIYNVDQNFTFRVDVNNLGVMNSYYYNFANSTLDSLAIYDALSLDYKTEISAINNNFTLDANSSNFYSKLEMNFDFLGTTTNLIGSTVRVERAVTDELNITTRTTLEDNYTITSFPFDYNLSVSHHDDFQNIVFYIASDTGDVNTTLEFILHRAVNFVEDVNSNITQTLRVMNITFDDINTVNQLLFEQTVSRLVFDNIGVASLNSYSLMFIESTDYALRATFSDNTTSYYNFDTGHWENEVVIPALYNTTGDLVINTAPITTSPANYAPILVTSFSDLNLSEDFLDLNLSILVSDFEGEDLNISIESNDTSILDINTSWGDVLVQLASYNDINQTFTLQSQANAYGTVRVDINVSDSEFSTLSSFLVDVVAVDDNITFTPIVDITLPEDSSENNITLLATDVDGDTITFTASSSDNALATVAIVNNILVITPLTNVQGVTTIEVNASSTSFVNTQSFTLTLSGVNDAPLIVTSFSDLNLSEDFLDLTLSILVSDLEGDDLNISIESNDTSV